MKTIKRLIVVMIAVAASGCASERVNNGIDNANVAKDVASGRLAFVVVLSTFDDVLGCPFQLSSRAGIEPHPSSPERCHENASK